MRELTSTSGRVQSYIVAAGCQRGSLLVPAISKAQPRKDKGQEKDAKANKKNRNLCPY